MRRTFPLKKLLDYVGLPRSTYCCRVSHPKRDGLAAEREMIKAVFDSAKGAYGYRRVALALERDYGVHLNRKTVAKVMRQEGPIARGRRKRGCCSHKGAVGKVAANVLARDLSASRPMEKLVSDATRFNVGGAKVYLSPLIDLYNGEVVAWRSGRSPSVDFVLGMLADAEGRLAGSGAVVHTDQGFQYQNQRWARMLSGYGCTQSMSRKGNCLDNACAESFFGHLKREFSDGSDFSQPGRFIRALDEWIAWYNTGRTKESLCGMAPVEYRLAHERPT